MAYRILSLDGGGAWAVIQVMALIDLYGDDNARGHDVLRDFDLVAANSGGSLVLGGLLEDFTLNKIKGFFENEQIRRSIFSPSSSFADRALHELTGMGPKYSAEAKLPAIETLTPSCGLKTLREAVAGIRRADAKEDLRALIVSFDYDRNRAAFFRSADSGGPELGYGLASSASVAEAIHASTNAPVNYFDAPAQFPGSPNRYWDGGITGMNNPLLAAVVEAVNIDVRTDDIVALSLGTATVALPEATPDDVDLIYTRKRGEQSLVQDLHKLATSILDDPPDMATFIAHLMTGGKNNLPDAVKSHIVRMNPLISPVGVPGHWRAPEGVSPAQFAFLVNLDMDAVQPGQVAAISSFASLWLKNRVSNQPLRMDCDTLACEIGNQHYGEAKAAWLALKAL